MKREIPELPVQRRERENAPVQDTYRQPVSEQPVFQISKPDNAVDDAVELAEQFLNAYDADDDGEALQALHTRLGLSNEPSVLAALLKHYAATH